MKKIIITGATSMVGTALIKEAVDHGVECYAVVRQHTSRIDRLPKSELVHVIYSDIANLYEINCIPQDCDVFYHFAWAHSSKLYRDDSLLQSENIQYTLQAVQLAKKCGCDKFVGAGSQAEYGYINEKIFSDTLCNPCNAYGISKFAAGKLSRKLCIEYGISHIWGRIFSVYGTNDNDGTMIDYAIKSFLKNEIAYFSSGVQPWDYLFESDVGKIFYLIGEKCNSHKTYNIASGKSHSIKEFINILAQHMNSLDLCHFEHKSENLLGLEVCIDDLINDIDYIPTVDFEKGIQLTIDSYMKNVMSNEYK